MAVTDWDGSTFEAHRPLLFSVAYTYSLDIAAGRVRAIYVVRSPDKLRRFLEHTH